MKAGDVTLKHSTAHETKFFHRRDSGGQQFAAQVWEPRTENELRLRTYRVDHRETRMRSVSWQFPTTIGWETHTRTLAFDKTATRRVRVWNVPHIHPDGNRSTLHCPARKYYINFCFQNSFPEKNHIAAISNHFLEFISRKLHDIYSFVIQTITWQCRNLMYCKKGSVYKLPAGWFINRTPGGVYNCGLFIKFEGLLCGNPTERGESLILNFWPPSSL